MKKIILSSVYIKEDEQIFQFIIWTAVSYIDYCRRFRIRSVFLF